MARTVVPVTDLTTATSVADPAGTAADPVNGHTITGVSCETVVLRVRNTTAGALNAILRAGTMPLAESSGQGDLTVSVAATTGSVLIGPFESARFRQADGSISLDLAATFAGNVTAFKVNRR